MSLVSLLVELDVDCGFTRRCVIFALQIYRYGVFLRYGNPDEHMLLSCMMGTEGSSAFRNKVTLKARISNPSLVQF